MGRWLAILALGSGIAGGALHYLDTHEARTPQEASFSAYFGEEQFFMTPAEIPVAAVGVGGVAIGAVAGLQVVRGLRRRQYP